LFLGINPYLLPRDGVGFFAQTEDSTFAYYSKSYLSSAPVENQVLQFAEVLAIFGFNIGSF